MDMLETRVANRVNEPAKISTTGGRAEPEPPRKDETEVVEKSMAMVELCWRPLHGKGYRAGRVGGSQRRH